MKEHSPTWKLLSAPLHLGRAASAMVEAFNQADEARVVRLLSRRFPWPVDPFAIEMEWERRNPENSLQSTLGCASVIHACMQNNWIEAVGKWAHRASKEQVDNALEVALGFTRTPMVELLLNAGASPNGNGSFCAISRAVRWGHSQKTSEALRLLVEHPNFNPWHTTLVEPVDTGSVFHPVWQRLLKERNWQTGPLPLSAPEYLLMDRLAPYAVDVLELYAKSSHAIPPSVAQGMWQITRLFLSSADPSQADWYAGFPRDFERLWPVLAKVGAQAPPAGWVSTLTHEWVFKDRMGLEHMLYSLLQNWPDAKELQQEIRQCALSMDMVSESGRALEAFVHADRLDQSTSGVSLRSARRI